MWGAEGKYLVQFPIDTTNTSGYLLTLIHETPRFLVSWLRNEVDFVQTGHNFFFPLKIREFLGLASYLVGMCCHLLLVFGLSCWVEGWAGSTARVVLLEREIEAQQGMCLIWEKWVYKCLQGVVFFLNRPIIFCCHRLHELHVGECTLCYILGNAHGWIGILIIVFLCSYIWLRSESC